MSIKVKVTSSGVGAKITPQKNLLVTKINESPLTTLGGLSDIDLSALADGAMLLYDSNTSTWKATTNMNNKNTTFNGGFF